MTYRARTTTDMTSQREFIPTNDYSDGGLEFIGPVGQHTLDIEGFNGGILFAPVYEPIKFEDRRLHLVELEEGAACAISPDYSQMSRERVMEELARINLVVSKGNFWNDPR